MIFKLPDLGEGLPEAEIHEWHVTEGDVVKVDQVMVSMETAKAVVEVPAPQSGKITKLYGKVGDVIKTGQPLVEFEASQQSSAITEKDSGTVVGNVHVGSEILKESPMGITPSSKAGSIKALPQVRALANKLGLDLASIKGTGPNKMITAQDVEAASKHLLSEPPKDYEPLRGVRRAMAQSMAKSHLEVVPVTLFDDADIGAWATGTDITLRVIRAIVTACKNEPGLNAWFHNESLARKLFSEVHIGVAMDSKEGLFVPVIKNAESRKPAEIRSDIERYKKTVSDRSIKPNEMKDFTIMLSNFGTFAGRYATPILVPPCVAILGTGKIREELVPVKGNPAIHKIIPLSLSFDHRAVTGGEASRFLGEIIEDLEKAT